MLRSSIFVVLVFAATALSAPGCTSNCRSNCPPTEVLVTASKGENLDLAAGATFTGPACRPALEYCTGDDVNPCVWFRIVGFAEGTCDVALTFKDSRPAITVHAEFGPATTQGCCRGYPVIGPATVTIPSLDGGTGDAPADAMSNDAPAPDAGTDTVTPDGGDAASAD